MVRRVGDQVITEVKRRFGHRKAIITMHSTEWGRCGKQVGAAGGEDEGGRGSGGG